MFLWRNKPTYLPTKLEMEKQHSFDLHVLRWFSYMLNSSEVSKWVILTYTFTVYIIFPVYSSLSTTTIMHDGWWFITTISWSCKTHTCKFQPEVHDMKINLFLVDFERVTLIQEPKFLVSFCIFSTCNNIPNGDKKFDPEVYSMRTGFFSRYFSGLFRL